MAGAEEVVAALEPVPTASSSPGSRSTSAATSGSRRPGSDEVRFAFGVDRVVQPAEPERVGRGVARRSTSHRRARARTTASAATLTLSVAFGCPFEGEVAESRVLELAERVAQAEPDVIVLADTIGVATPTRGATRSIERVAALGVPVGGHFHNTRNTGYANALAALEAGATVLDASIGGLGGCPFAPSATGNIATEDLVYLLERRGRRDRRRPRRAHRTSRVARGAARPAARRPALPRRPVLRA